MICENKDYKTNPGTYCLSNCIFNYVKLLSPEIEELDILFDCDFKVIYMNDDSSIPSLNVPINESVFRFLKNKNIKFIEKKDNENAELWLQDHIKNNNFVIGHIRTEYLKYNNFFINNKVTDARHYVNVIGSDDSKGVFISDGYIPTYPIRTYEGWLEFDFDHKMNQFIHVNLDEVEDIQSLFNHSNEDYQTKLIYIIEQFLLGGSDEDYCYGYSAYEHYYNDLVKLRQEPRIQNENMYYKIVFSYTTGGLVSSKRLLKQLVRKLSLEQYIPQFEKLIRNLELLKLLMLKCSVAAEEKNLIDVENLIQEILHFEMNLYTEILEKIKY